MIEYALVGLALFLAKICYERENIDFSKVETTCRTLTLPECVHTTERVRRVTWRFGVLGSLALSLMLYAMGVTTKSTWIHSVLASWIVITSCMNFRAYHVEDELTSAFKKTYKE